jgi:hypothetical protein
MILIGEAGGRGIVFTSTALVAARQFGRRMSDWGERLIRGLCDPAWHDEILGELAELRARCAGQARANLRYSRDVTSMVMRNVRPRRFQVRALAIALLLSTLGALVVAKRQLGVRCLQPVLKFEGGNPDNAHLNSTTGRTWTRLEWRALAEALLREGPPRVQALRDALAFREVRLATAHAARADEQALLISEGVARSIRYGA